jgi:Lipase (class 3)
MEGFLETMDYQVDAPSHTRERAGGVSIRDHRRQSGAGFVLAILIGSLFCHMSMGSAVEDVAYQSGDVSNKGFKYEEAAQFIEFCVELDDQDDRQGTNTDPKFFSHIDERFWDPVPVYDSRRAIADDVVSFAKDAVSPAYSHWQKSLSAASKRATRKYGVGFASDSVFSDPILNGFGPWGNAWLLYRGRGKYAGSYAIAIRGTVFSFQPSATENAWFHTVESVGFLSPSVQFAGTRNASLHSGFAHATFSLLLDDRYGILRILNDRHVPEKTSIFITGHSQGAAMATLVHAFMHYSMRADDAAASPVFGLRNKEYRLKSYGFAQPKPGDYLFSMDFARITQAADNAIVVNNTLDVVPQVPMTLQSLGDLQDDLKNIGTAEKVIQLLSSTGSGVRRSIALVAEPLEKRTAKGYGYYYHYEELVAGGKAKLGSDKTASTWNFAPAGHVLFVYGTPGDPHDAFLQHHAWTYRALMEQQLKSY